MKKYFNLAELNFVLTICGFRLFTVFVQDSAGSVMYRLFALIVALMCLFTYRDKLIKSKPLTTYWVILTLVIVCCLYDLFIGYYSGTQYVKGRNMAALFVVGIVFIPVLAFYRSFNHIRWERVLHILFMTLFFILAWGFTHATVEESGRMNLNSHSSTLALGDLGAYLVCVSAAILSKAKTMKLKKWYVLLLISGIFLGVLSVGRAGSRGPFLGMVAALTYFFFAGNYLNKTLAVFFTIIAMSFGVFTASFLEKLAPVLFDRMTNTIQYGEMSGREEIFQKGITILRDHPLTGGQCISINGDSFSNYHNVYLNVAIELGVIGGIVFVVLLLMLLYKTLFKFKNIGETPALPFFSAMLMFNMTRGLSGISIADNEVFSVTSIGLMCCHQVLSQRLYVRKAKSFEEKRE